MILAKPPGFFGHFAAWLPVFDFAYGKCIADFIERPTSGTCTIPSISNDDFRSIVDLGQLPEHRRKFVKSVEPLVGRSFVAYTLTPRATRHYQYTSVVQRGHMASSGTTYEVVSFRQGLHCAAGAVMSSKILQWREAELLEFDAGSGKLIGWWVEQRWRDATCITAWFWF